MKLCKKEPGVWVSFEYESADGVWMPRTAILKAKRDTKRDPLRHPSQGLRRGRWLFLMFDVARGCERWFYACRMRHVRPVQIPAVYGSKNEAEAYAGGWERSGSGQRAVSCARLVHGWPQKWAVLATLPQPVECKKTLQNKGFSQTA